jgi:uncharacterized tellurite resistance protein B-like protein
MISPWGSSSGCAGRTRRFAQTAKATPKPSGASLGSWTGSIRPARYLAAFAYVLSRVAGSDLHISDAETDRIVDLVQRIGHLPESQAILVAQIAKSQNQLFGGTENFLVTREFKNVATEEQRRELLDRLFAVSAADHAITGEEEAQIWQIASELGISHPEYIAARLRYSDKRTVLRGTKD